MGAVYGSLRKQFTGAVYESSLREQSTRADDSREVLVCKGFPFIPDSATRFSRVSTIRCLGHHIQDDAGIKDCVRYVKGAMWRSFYGNLTPGLVRASVAAKMRFLQSSIRSLASFRWSRWPYQRS